MRIRSIKPEFWSHPITGRWRGELQAFAISLLNAADDEGYFYADPAAVRSAVRPFDEDSTTTRRLLVELSSQGWIEVFDHASRGAIGAVRKFSDHQRIDRPKPSELRVYFDQAASKSERLFVDDESTTNRRSVDDRSLLEGNREQGEEQGTGRGAADAAPAPAPVAKVHPLQVVWNELKAPEQPRWAETSKARKVRADSRWRERTDWPEVVKRIAASKFCRGINDRGWKADPEWLLKPDTATKVLEGRYDDREGVSKPGAFAQPSDWTDVTPGEVTL